MGAIRALIAQSLREAAPDASWIGGGIDRADECAELLLNAGIQNLALLGIRRVDVWEAFKSVGFAVDPKNENEYQRIKPDRMADQDRTRLHSRLFGINSWFKQDHAGRLLDEKKLPEEVLAIRGFTPFVFTYESRQMGFIGDANNDGSISNAAPFFKVHPLGLMFAWSARGDGGCAYVITPTETGFAFIPAWGKNPDAAYWKQTIAMGVAVFGMGFALAGLSMGLSVGKALVSTEFAAAYPKLTAAIGQTTLATAANGGDVERAALSSLATYGGSIAGGYAAGLTDSRLIGTVAQSATQAALTGGDVERAAGMAVLQFGANAGAAAIRQPAPVAQQTEIPKVEISSVDTWGSGGIESYSPFDWGGATVADMPTLSTMPGFTFDTSPLTAPFLATDFGVPSVQAFLPDTLPLQTAGDSWGDFQLSVPRPALPPEETPSAWRQFASEAVRQLPKFIGQILKPPQTAPRGTNPAAVPVNQPTVMPDGSVVVRAPDGEITIIGRDGRISTSGGSGFMGMSPAMVGVIGVGALAAILLLRKR